MTLWRYFTEKEIKIRLSLIALFFCFVILQLIHLRSLIFESVSKSLETSVMELFLILVSNFLVFSNVARTSILGVVGALNPSLLLKFLFSRVILLKVLVFEFALIIGILWQCTFNTVYKLFLMKIYACLLQFHIMKFSSKRFFLLSSLNCHGKV